MMPGRTFAAEHRRRKEWCNTCKNMKPLGHSLICTPPESEELPPIEPKATGVVYRCVKTESSSQLRKLNPGWQHSGNYKVSEVKKREGTKMDWVAIIMAILEVLGPLLKDCFSPDEAGVRKLRRSLGRVYRSVYRESLKLGLSRPEAKRMAQERAQEIREATDAELLELLKDAHADA